MVKINIYNREYPYPLTLFVSNDNSKEVLDDIEKCTLNDRVLMAKFVTSDGQTVRLTRGYLLNSAVLSEDVIDNPPEKLDSM